MKTLVYNKSTKSFSEVKYDATQLRKNIESSVKAAKIPESDKSAMANWIESNLNHTVPIKFYNEYGKSAGIDLIRKLYKPENTDDKYAIDLYGGHRVYKSLKALEMLAKDQNPVAMRFLEELPKYVGKYEDKYSDDLRSASGDPTEEDRIKYQIKMSAVEELLDTDNSYKDAVTKYVIGRQLEKFNNWRFDLKLAVAFVEFKYSTMRGSTLDKYR